MDLYRNTRFACVYGLHTKCLDGLCLHSPSNVVNICIMYMSTFVF